MQTNLKILSLNINGLNSPLKKGKVMTKLKKEEVQIIFLQETHLSKGRYVILKGKLENETTALTSAAQGDLVLLQPNTFLVIRLSDILIIRFHNLTISHFL
uniref:Endonuclease/exonuclease/phosphatase domain-containing protein n=1 Tax=Sphaeramia orbicularis TaxID=375764 RepID=A0A673A625_9TELE